MPRTSQGTRTNRHHKPSEIPDRYEPGFLKKLDARTEIARQLKASYEQVVSDLGGQSEISHVKNSLVERFIFLEAVLGGIENQLALARTGDVDEEAARKLEAELIGRWVQAVNSLQGLAKVLGVERRAKTPF